MFSIKEIIAEIPKIAMTTVLIEDDEGERGSNHTPTNTRRGLTTSERIRMGMVMRIIGDDEGVGGTYNSIAHMYGKEGFQPVGLEMGI